MSVPYSFPLFRRLVCLIGLVLWTASAEAQLRTAAITGTVTDGSGGVLPGATVEALVAGETVALAVTGPDGRYRIELAAPVQQQLRVRRDGFADQTVDVQPAPGGATRDFRLRLAALALGRQRRLGPDPGQLGLDTVDGVGSRRPAQDGLPDRRGGVERAGRTRRGHAVHPQIRRQRRPSRSMSASAVSGPQVPAG